MLWEVINFFPAGENATTRRIDYPTALNASSRKDCTHNGLHRILHAWHTLCVAIFRSTCSRKQRRLWGCEKSESRAFFVWRRAMSTYDVILHPTDFSEDSDLAFQLACSIAREQFAALVVVHVLSPEFSPNGQSNDVALDPELPIVRDCHEKFCRMKSQADDIPISFRIVSGYSVGAILNVSHEENADLIIIASHQQTRFHLQVHGSVTEGLLRQSHCPLMVLCYPVPSMIRQTLPTDAKNQ